MKLLELQLTLTSSTSLYLLYLYHEDDCYCTDNLQSIGRRKEVRCTLLQKRVYHYCSNSSGSNAYCTPFLEATFRSKDVSKSW